MQVSIDNDELEKKVAIALKGINGRSLAQAILKCIIIKAKEDEILLEATNLEIGLRVKVDGTVEEEGCCAIGEDQTASQRCRELSRTSGSDRNGSELQRFTGSVERCLKWCTIFDCSYRSKSNAVGGTC